MNTSSPKDIVYYRTTGVLKAPSIGLLMQARLMQASMLALSPFGYLGISRVHGTINKILRPRSFTSIIDGKSNFRFPSDDYYWNRMLTSSWKYEPEIDLLLKRIAHSPFIFLDLGANYGYWSERFAAGLYGNHQVIAVEASGTNYKVLKLNVEAASSNVKIYHAAVEEVSGKIIPIFGERHAGLSIKSDWPGASRKEMEKVESISIDDLLKREKIDLNNVPTVIKLDIEGAEFLALKGAHKAMSGQSVFLMEDAQKNDISDAVRYAHDDCAMSLFSLSETGIKRINRLAELKAEKDKFSSVGQVGFNLIATSSDHWCDILDQLETL